MRHNFPPPLKALTLFLLFIFSTPLFAQEPITPTNATQLIETAHFGYGQVNDLTFSPDGTRLFIATPADLLEYATSDYDLSPKLWIIGLAHSINFSPDETQIIIGGKDQTTIWDLATREKTATFDGTNGLWIAGDDWLVTNLLNQIFIWDIATGEKIKQFEQEHIIDRLLFNPQQNILITYPKQLDDYNQYGSFEVFNIHTGEHLTPIEITSMTLKDANISPDGNYFAHAGWWGVDLGQWDDGAYNQIGYQTDSTCCRVADSSVTFTPDGAYLVGGTANGGIDFWNLESLEHQLFRSYSVHAEVKKIRFQDQMEQFAVVSQDGIITVWNLATDEVIARLTGYSYQPNALGIQIDNQTLVTASRFGAIWHWDIPTQQQTFVKQAYHYRVGQGTIPYHSGVVINREADLIATNVSNETSVVIRSIDGTVVRRIQKNEQWDIYQILFSPDSQEILMTGTMGEIWSIHDPDKRRIGSEEGDYVLYHPDGEHVFTTDPIIHYRPENTIYLMPIDREYDNPYLSYNPDLKPVLRFEGLPKEARGIAVNRDGSLFVAFHTLEFEGPYTRNLPQALYIWDGETGEQRHIIEAFPNHIFHMVFANHSNLLAIHHSDTVDIWDAETGVRLASIPQEGIADLVFSHDDSMLIGALKDGTIKIWAIPE